MSTLALLTKKQNGWCSTNKGINFIDPNSAHSKAFNRDFNLSDITFISHSALRFDSDSFYFGGLNGMIQFNPNEIERLAPNLIAPVFNNLLVANKKISISSTSQETQFCIATND